MRLGFTGTQIGMSNTQSRWFQEYIIRSKPEFFHHGLCIGADYQAHWIVRRLLPHCIIVGHPPVNISKMAVNVQCDVLRKAKPYLERNQDIVDECDILIAMPKTEFEQIRSGTWSTIRRARNKFKFEPNSVMVISP